MVWMGPILCPLLSKLISIWSPMHSHPKSLLSTFGVFLKIFKFRDWIQSPNTETNQTSSSGPSHRRLQLAPNTTILLLSSSTIPYFRSLICNVIPPQSFPQYDLVFTSLKMRGKEERNTCDCERNSWYRKQSKLASEISGSDNSRFSSHVPNMYKV